MNREDRLILQNQKAILKDLLNIDKEEALEELQNRLYADAA